MTNELISVCQIACLQAVLRAGDLQDGRGGQEGVSGILRGPSRSSPYEPSCNIYYPQPHLTQRNLIYYMLTLSRSPAPTS